MESLQMVHSVKNFGFFLFFLQNLYGELRSFASSADNATVDTCFVVLMGHGYSEGSSTFLMCPDGPFDIWSNCSSIFTNQNSHIKNKPKLCFAQLCRGTFANQ